MFALKFASLFILAYLLGSFPTGVLVGKTFFHKDIRKYGSGNIGTTNTFRVLGPVAGIIVFLVDFFKGTLATLIPVIFNLGAKTTVACVSLLTCDSFVYTASPFPMGHPATFPLLRIKLRLDQKHHHSRHRVVDKKYAFKLPTSYPTPKIATLSRCNQQ